MKCSDIDEMPILKLLADRAGIPQTWFEGVDNSIADAMPKGVPASLAIAKMKRLIGRGLVHGCGCGCRGDYILTGKGMEYLKQKSSRDEGGGG